MAKGSVETYRKELTDMLPYYTLIEDALAGEKVIKSKNVKYLPLPSECGTYADPRYQAYLLRALYYNVTLPTRDALVGQLFLRPPMVELPPKLAPLEENINGEGLSLNLLVRKAANHVLPFGRGGFLTDFPTTKKELTLADIESGEYNPFIQFYPPWAIRNWQVEKIGNLKKLTLLVLEEAYEKLDDDFTVKIESQFRVYRLLKNKCTVQLYRNNVVVGEGVIKDSTGNSLNEIPFEFIGSENNDADVDYPPFYNLANLNIAHFRNSADYEESVFLVGQPTPVYSGLTEDWVNNYFGNGVPFGSRASVTLPVGASAELLQAEPNTLAFEAMRHKEEQMIAIGAKIINPKNNVERREVEVQIEAASQKSVLMTIRDNLQKALIRSLQRACSFVGENPETIKVELNDNFDLTGMSAEQLRYLTELYKENGIAFSEFRENLRRSGIAKLKDEEAKTEIMADKAMKDALVPALELEKAKPKPVGNNPNQ